MVTFQQIGGQLKMEGVVGKDLAMDILFEDTVLTGYTFVCYVILEKNPLEKRYAVTITNTDLAQGQIKASLTDTQTTEIGPVSGKTWFLQGSHGGFEENLLAGIFQLNRF